MRQLTAQQTKVLGLADRSSHARVKVDRGGSNFVDMSTLEGRNWVSSVTWSDGNDAPTMTATVEFIRQHFLLNLSPLLGASKLNAGGVLIEPGAEIVIEVATMPMDVPPAESDWVEVFRGHIDKVEFAGPTIKADCRDQGNVVVDRFIETQQVYGSDEGTPAQTAMQSILTDHVGSVTLYSPNGTGGTPFNPADAPGWMLRAWKQSKQSVHQALRTIAQQIGWEVKYRWHENTSAFQLVFYDPERPRRARGTMTFTGQPSNNETFALNGSTFTAKSSGAGANEFNISSTVIATLDALVTMFNSGAQSANAYAWRIGHTVLIEWKTPGTAGNAVAFTESLSNATVDGGGLLGGTQAGTDAAVDWTFTPGRLWKFAHLSVDRIGVRNVVRGTYQVRPSTGALTLDASASGTFTRASGSFLADGLEAGMRIEVGGFANDGNNRQFVISSVTATVITVVDATTMVTESGDGDEHIISVTPEKLTVTRDDAASIAKYGRLYMEFTEASTSQIDTTTELVNMVTACLDDLKDPTAELGVEMPFFWPVETGDYFKFTANDHHFDTDQSLAVVSFQHTISATKASTALVCRGKPAGAGDRWKEIQGRPGIAPAVDLYEDAAAGGVSVTPALQGIAVVYDDPRAMNPPVRDWAYTECHVQLGTSDYTPSAATLAARGMSTRFDITGLVPGAEYTVKLRIIDLAGNVAAASTFIARATQRVGPYHENPDGQVDQLLRNNDFNIWTLGDSVMPDAWSMVTGDYGADVVRDDSDSATGNYALDFEVVSGTMEPAIESRMVAIGGGSDTRDILQAAILCKRVGGSSNARVQLDVNFYDRDGAFISTTSTQFTPTTDYSVFQTAAIRAPATAAFAGVEITGTYSSGVTYTLRVDRASLLRSYSFGHVDSGATSIAFTTSETTLTWSSVESDHIGVGTVDLEGSGDDDALEIIYPGVYLVSADVFASVANLGSPSFEVLGLIQVDQGAGFATVAAAADSSKSGLFGASVRARAKVAAPAMHLEKGDRIRVRGQTSATGFSTENLQLVRFSVRQIVRSEQ